MDTSLYMRFISAGLFILILILLFAIYWQIKARRSAYNRQSRIGQLTKVIENIPFAIYLQKIAFDNKHNQMKSMEVWNQEMVKLLGKRTDDIGTLLEEKSKIEFEKAQESAFKLTGTTQITKNLTFETRQEKKFDGFMQLRMLTIEGDRFLLGIIVNTSELKTAINNGIANHQEEKTFLANISHEIRTPLSAVMGLAQLLINEKDTNTIHEYGELINEKSKHLKHIINDVLLLSKLERGELQFKKLTVMVQEEVKKSIADAEALAKALNKKSFKYCLPYETVKQTFSYELQGFIHNHLLYNAVQFSTKGHVECGMLFEDGKQIIYAYNSFFKPISPDDCIDAFYRFTKPNTFIQGIGIGLTICRMITEYLGGSIGFNGDIDNGVLIWAELPALYSATGKDEHEVKRIMSFLDARWDGIWFDEKGLLHKPTTKGGRL